MRRLFLTAVVLAALMVGCGDDDTHGAAPTTTPEPLTPTTTTATGSPTTDDELASALPAVEQVTGALGLELTEREVRDDLSQAFEGVDDADLNDGVMGLYGGSGEEEFAIIDVARFVSVEAATAFLPPADDAQAMPVDGTPIDLIGVGDQALGVVRPAEGGEQSLVLVRVGRLVSVIVVQAPAGELSADGAAGVRQLAANVAAALSSLTP